MTILPPPNLILSIGKSQLYKPIFRQQSHLKIFPPRNSKSVTDLKFGFRILKYKRNKPVFHAVHVFPILWLMNEKPLFEDRPIDVAPCRGNERNEGKKVEVTNQEAHAQENIRCIHRVPDHSVETV